MFSLNCLFVHEETISMCLVDNRANEKEQTRNLLNPSNSKRMSLISITNREEPNIVSILVTRFINEIL